MSCECKCKLDGRKCNSNKKCKNDNCQCKCKNPKEHRVYEKYYIWNPATCSCENGKYLASIIDNTVIVSSHGEETKTVTTNFNEIMQSVKKSYIFYLAFD